MTAWMVGRVILAGTLLAPAYAELPLRREEGLGATAGMSWGLQLVLAGALVALLAGVYQLRRRQLSGAQAGGALRSVQALRLAQGASLHVVHWGGEEMLLACTAAGVTVLSRRLPAPGGRLDSAAGKAPDKVPDCGPDQRSAAA